MLSGIQSEACRTRGNFFLRHVCLAICEIAQSCRGKEEGGNWGGGGGLTNGENRQEQVAKHSHMSPNCRKNGWLSPFLCQAAKTKVAKIRTFSDLLAIS